MGYRERAEAGVVGDLKVPVGVAEDRIDFGRAGTAPMELGTSAVLIDKISGDVVNCALWSREVAVWWIDRDIGKAMVDDRN